MGIGLSRLLSAVCVCEKMLLPMYILHCVPSDKYVVSPLLQGPRNSIGPDVQHFILGSEGIKSHQQSHHFII